MHNCTFICHFGDVTIDNCGEISTGDCTLNVMLSAEPYKDLLLNADSVSSIIGQDAQGVMRSALNFINNDTQGEVMDCMIMSKWPVIMSDRMNSFNASC